MIDSLQLWYSDKLWISILNYSAGKCGYMRGTHKPTQGLLLATVKNRARKCTEKNTATPFGMQT